MSSKKGAKKNRARCPKPEDHSAEQVVFGLLSELLSRGVEQGAYRWCLQKNADPARTVFISCVPAEMPDGVICSVMARTLNRGQVRLVDTVKAEDSIYQSLLVEAEGKMDSSICPTLIRCEDCPLGYWIMVAPVEDHNMEPPPAKALPPAKEPPPAKTLLPAKEPPPEKALPPAKTLPPAKEPPPEKTLPPAKQPPPAKTLLPAKELPPEKALPPAKTLPPAKEPPPEKTLPPAKQPPPAKTLLPAKEPPPAKALSPAKEPPPSASLSPAKEPPLAKALLPAKGQPPAKQPPPANEQPPSAALSPVKEPPPAKALPPVKEPPPAKALPPVKEPPPAKALPPVKEPPPAKALPPVKEPPPAKALPPVKEPPPAKALPPVKEPPPAKALPPVKEPPPAQALSPAKDPPAAQVPPPATEPPMIDKKAKEENLQIVINGSVGLGIQLQNSGNFDTVFREQSPILNFGNGDKPEPPIMNRSETVTKARYNAVWGGFSMERQKRREDIEKGLHFIQSTIPFNGSEDANKHFLQELVENLFTEGNDLYREGEVKLALGQYTEGLTVAEYAASEELTLSQELVCRLFVNRSCCYYSMGLFEKSLEDSDRALNLDKENMRALYRKARALNKLGNHQEAYTCISHRILVLVQDESVTELAQELVQKLGLKQRRAYKRPQQELETYGLMSNGLSTSAGCKASNGMGSVDDIYTDFAMDSKLFPSTLGISCQSDGLVTAACPPSMASTTNPVNDFIDCDVIGDELDSFLDFEMASKQVPQLIPVFPTGNQLLSTLGTAVLPAASPLPPASFGLLNPLKQAVVPLQPTFSIHLDTLDSFGTARETLDSLDTFVNDSKHLEPLSLKGNQKQKPGGITVNHLFTQKTDHIQSLIPTLPQALPANPLAHTHDFKQGCLLCYVKTGPRAVDYTHKEKLEHKCKKDILLGRMKSSENKAWLKIRLRPMKVNFNGPFMLCKDIQSRQDCKYGDNCTFAYYQEEIDVWNEERKGAFHRDQLFQPPGLVKPGSVSRLLHEQMGIFTFLCQACFNSKPKIISKRNPENPDFCTNPSNQHSFPDHKCLVHVLNSSTVKYSKIRPIHIRFQMDMCRHEIRYGCLQEDTCNFAHSHVELCVWMLQKQSGVSQEEIVLESERMWKVAEPKVKPPTKSLDMKMKFVCGQCLQNGREIEADRDGKYCTAKARHSWTKDKRVLLVMSKAKTKWVPIRPLPSVRSFPQQYEICVHVQNGKKCQYIGICTFAHNSEEKDIWTFMKENKVLDLQLIFDLCKKNSSAEKPGKTAATLGPQKETEKPIVMPTDYADLMAGFHCYLCGKNSNSERQWQKHIQSEKHKDRVFTLESEESIWKYRFPAGEFKLCERFEETQNCPNENNCPFAHGREELAEWHERRQVLQYKVSKARKDMLLEPSDSDFGKYSFLMQDLAEVSEESGIAGTLWSKVLSP